MENRQLNVVVDMHGCPNRCLHCWLGHMPNRNMEDGADQFIMAYFSSYFDRIAYYSWVREPDFCDDYNRRWETDVEISQNTSPLRFELASFYRIVRDPKYIPFLKSVGVEKVQLTFFGLKEIQDRYVGRKGAYDEIMQATDILIENGMIPRWQCFINEENVDDILVLYQVAQEIRKTKCAALEFFVHEGSCDGENRKLYPIRMEKQHIPEELLPVYLEPEELFTEEECCEQFKQDMSHPEFDLDGDITLNISNTYDVYFNITHMTRPWIIGNMKQLKSEEMVRRIIQKDTYALNEAKQVTWAGLVAQFGNATSQKVFRLDDYKIYLFNQYLEFIEK